MPVYLTCRFLALPVLLCIPAVVAGQAPPSPPLKVVARVDRAEVVTGRPIQVTVEISGCTGTPQVRVPDSPDFTIRLAGQGVRPSLLAGLGEQEKAGQGLVRSLRDISSKLPADAFDPNQVKGLGDPDLAKQYQAALANLAALKRNDHVFTYLVEPKRTGEITVPAFLVSADGRSTATQPLSMHVSDPKPQNLVRLALSLSEPRPLVGQEVQLYIDVLIRREAVSLGGKNYPHLPLKDVYITLPPLDNQTQFELARPLAEAVAGHAPQPGHRGYRLNGGQAEAVFDREPAGAAGDPSWYVRRLALPLRFRQASKGTLAAARAAGDVFLPGQPAPRQPALRGKWQAFAAASDPVDFEVRGLPAGGGRPRDFSGNIGLLRLSAAANQTRMPIGTPFALTVRVEGHDYLPETASLDLEKRPEFSKSFRVRLEQDKPVSDKARELTFTLRPLDAGVKEVPPVTLWYFDPQTDQYKVAATQPIPLEVTPGAKAGVDVPPPAQEPKLADVPRSEEGLPPLAESSDLWGRDLLAKTALLGAGVGVGLALGGGLLVRGARRLRQRRASVAVVRHQRSAAGEVRRQLHAGDLSVSKVRETLQAMLRHQFGMPAGEITPQDAADCLRRAGVSPGLAHSCAALLETCTAAEFAPGMLPVSLDELAAAADRLVAETVTESTSKQAV